MLGPSGCGKTTTLRMVAGFEDLDEGEISVGDRLLSSSAKDYYLAPEKRNFGMVFQAFAVWPHLNVFDNVAFPLKIRHLSRAEIGERTRSALSHIGLANYENAYPNELSSGQKQRIALARAIAINPEVMLLDEPLSNLDPKLREEMRFEIKDLQRKFGFTILFVTHDQSEAMALSDRILVMRDGVAQQVDTPINIYTRPANRFIFSFIGVSNFIPATLNGGKIYVENAEAAGAISCALPPDLISQRLTVACRPSEIDLHPIASKKHVPATPDLDQEDGVRATIKRKAYLGDLIDYRVQVGATEIRVQKGRRSVDFAEGDSCCLKFKGLHYYPAE